LEGKPPKKKALLFILEKKTKIKGLLPKKKRGKFLFFLLKIKCPRVIL
jgi:hypothetical protein